VEIATAELDALRRHRTLAQKLQQEGDEYGAGVVLPPEVVARLDRLESELRKVGINVAGYSVSNIIKGTAQTVNGVISTVIGSIAGFGTTKGLGRVTDNATSTLAGALTTEVTTSEANKNLNEHEK